MSEKSRQKKSGGIDISDVKQISSDEIKALINDLGESKKALAV